MIPRKRDELRAGRSDCAAYRERNRLNQHRAIATRDEKPAAPYEASLTTGCIPHWLSALSTRPY